MYIIEKMASVTVTAVTSATATSATAAATAAAAEAEDLSTSMLTPKFVLQVVGITPAKLLSRPSIKCPSVGLLSDVLVLKDSRIALAHTPSLSCGGMVESGADIFVAVCPPEDYELSLSGNSEQFTHSVFLYHYKETPENDQIICVNPHVAIEIMESAIEKNLMRLLPPVKQFKRNVPLQLEGKINSIFSFVGICQNGKPFIMDVNNVPLAEYNHGLPNAFSKITPATSEYDFNTKSAYFPEKNADSREMIRRINELAIIASESSVRCFIAYVVQRTDIDKFELSVYDTAYRTAVKTAVDKGVCIISIVVSWTNDGNAIFVTDELSVLKPNL